jgi:predicted phosphodiesterase
MKIVAVGDLSFKNEDEKKDTIKTIKNISTENADLVIALGDLSYTKKADPFLHAIEDIGINKIKPVIGNHDDDEKLDDDEAEQFWNDVNNTFKIGKPYYSFIKENIYFIVLYTNTDFIADETQKNFAIQELEKAKNNSNIDWKVVCYHKPSVTSATSGGHAPEAGFARIYHSLFDQFDADLILTGHNHNYQRSKLVRHNPDPNHATEPIVVEHDGNEEYDTREGRIFMVVGSGGREKEGFENSEPEEFIKFRQYESNGIFSIEFESNKRIKCKFIANDKSVFDPFIIDKSA